MSFDQPVNLADMKRHDYLPSAKNWLLPLATVRPAKRREGYAGGDGLRQQFTRKDRDLETAFYSGFMQRFKELLDLVNSNKVT